MLIGCITGPDLETAKRQLKAAKTFCNGIELRKDLLETPFEVPDGFVITTTEMNHSILSDGRKISIYHNFNETPKNLEEILLSLPRADIYKIATMASKITDSLRMLAFMNNYKNVAGMCMGRFGQITRILGPIFGSPLTFAALGTPGAPGQLQAEDLVKTYRFHSLSPKTKIFGLIGNPISHSLSHLKHNAFFAEKKIDAVYVKMELQEEELPEFFALAKELGFSGLSVTRPFKEKVQPFVDFIEKEAAEIGAINTLTFKEGQIYGANTDSTGALDALEETTLVAGKKIVILGAGGASKAIAYEAKKRGGEVTILSRRFGNLSDVPLYDILINTTPVPAPIPAEELQPKKIVMDISPRHKNSPWMAHAKQIGCESIDGGAMFDKQALGQFLRWGLLA